jgi:RHS repeat-associated protein
VPSPPAAERDRSESNLPHTTWTSQPTTSDPAGGLVDYTPTAWDPQSNRTKPRGPVISKFLWTLDAASNPTKVQTTRGTSDTYDAYEYDARNRLIASCFGVSSGASNCSGASNKITYAYDKVSNRTEEVRTGSVGNTGTITYDYNSADQLTETDNGTTTTTYTYDANGNQASAGSRSLTYDLANRLVSTTAASVTTTYAYDGDDRRVSTTVGGGADLNLVWDPLAASGIPELALERQDDGDLIRRYTTGPLGAIYMETPSETFFYHSDPLGTITDLTDESGDAQWRYTYEAYGAQLSATNVSGTAPENRLRFTGQYLDPETGDYHLRARQYDPATGRLGAVDPVENLYTDPYVAAYIYANARPTVLRDPTGCVLDSGGLPSCRSRTHREAGARIAVQVSFAGYLQWGISIVSSPLHNAGPWWVDVYVNSRLVDRKTPPRQVYEPHGSLPPKIAKRGARFFIWFYHESFARRWWRGHMACRIP